MKEYNIQNTAKVGNQDINMKLIGKDYKNRKSINSLIVGQIKVCSSWTSDVPHNSS